MCRARHRYFLFSLATLVLVTATATAEQRQAFTVTILPDTQAYAIDDPSVYLAQTQWIRDNAEAENIDFVVHMGDIVESRNASEPEWQAADAAHDVLELNPPIPYSVMVGNHDVGDVDGQGTHPRDATLYNQYFGPQRFTDASWYGGHMGPGNESNYCYFQSSGMDFMVLSLEFMPRDETLTWASGVLAANPDRRTIITTHYYLEGSSRWNGTSYGTLSDNNGQQVWDKLIRHHDNIFMVLSGHLSGESTHIAENDFGHDVIEIRTDYQDTMDGWLRNMRFEPEENTIHLRSYSPLLDAHDGYGAQQQVYYDMNGSGTPPDDPSQNDMSEIGRLSAQTTLIDFGVSDTVTDDVGREWNSISGPRGVIPGDGRYLENGRDIDGNATDIDVTFTLIGTPQFSTPTARPDDTQVDDAFIGFPETAYGDTIVVYDDNALVVNVEDLDPDAKYTFWLFGLRGSSIGGTGPRVTQYTLDDETQQVDAWDNQSTCAVFRDLMPDESGTISFLVEATTFDNTNGYLTAMAVERQLTPGDANGDGVVNEDDAAILAENWQTASGATWAEGDFNRDGAVDAVDVTIMAANWQPDVGNTASAPEPATVMLLLSAVAWILISRHPFQG